MKYLNKYEMFNEAVNFFEKGKFWLINGKKVKVVGSIPQNPQVLKFQEVDETGKTIGKMFVGKKGEVKGWKDPKKEKKKTLNNHKIMLENENLNEPQDPQLNIGAVSGSLSLETIADYVTKKDLSVHKKIVNLWLKSGNEAKDFPKLPPCWIDVEITLKNGKKYKSFLASINNWGGVQFVINRMFKERIYLDTEEVVSWEFV